MQIGVNTASDVELQLIKFQTTGYATTIVGTYSSMIEMHSNSKFSDFFNCSTDNGELILIVRLGIVQRNGKSYIVINDVSTSCDASNIQIEVTYPNASTFMSNAVNRVVNGNWRLFKDVMYASFEKYCLDILLKKYLVPILNQVACQDFINM